MAGRALTLPAGTAPSPALPGWLLLTALAVATTVFYAFPQLDLTTSRWLTNHNGMFALEQNSWLLALNHAISWSSRVLAVVLICGVALAWWPPKAATRRLAWLIRQRRTLLFLLVALALGPGLLVNSVLKEYSGRARPSTVVEFGGTHHFTPAFVFTDQCAHNCAFVSGHAAVAAFPVAGSFIARRRRMRQVWLGAGLAIGFTIGFARMVTGSHFLSDVVIGILCTYLVAAACAAWLLRPRPPRAESTA